MENERSRVLGCLAGLAVGDAMGRPTELLFNYRRIEKRFGRVETLVGDRPGAVTDDTRLTLKLADAIITRGRMVSSDELMELWKRDPDFSWRKFLKAFQRDEGFWIGEHIAAWGGRLGVPGHLTGYMNPTSLVTGNEAAMMVSPVGVLFRGDPGGADRAAREVSRAVIAGEATADAGAWAAAVAAALSEGATVESVVDTMKRHSGHRLRSAVDRALSIAGRHRDAFSARPELYRCCLQPVPLGARETLSIAMAMFVLAGGEPMEAVIGGANFGRDSDTIAGMAGLLAGALGGVERLDRGVYRKVVEVNGFDLETYAERLVSIGRGKVRPEGDGTGPHERE